jgi:hypothetical protein
MASNIFWLVVTATLLSLVTYCLFNPPGNRKTGALNRDHLSAALGLFLSGGLNAPTEVGVYHSDRVGNLHRGLLHSHGRVYGWVTGAPTTAPCFELRTVPRLIDRRRHPAKLPCNRLRTDAENFALRCGCAIRADGRDYPPMPVVGP